MVRHVVILAGGSGTRLWPASRAAFPKQFLRLRGNRSLFQETLERAGALGHSGTLTVVTHVDHVEEIVRQWSELDPATREYRAVVLPEPVARNTAPAVAYAAAFLRAEGQGASSFLVLPSDHVIDPIDAFKGDVENAAALAEKGRLVTFGIPPRGPETGYGYIEAGEEVPPGKNVKSFHEKPDEAAAEEYLERGNFYWNSGMFAFRVDTMLDQMKRHCPSVVDPLEGIEIPLTEIRGISRPADLSAVRAAYERISPDSIDYALMEKSDITAMISSHFNWSDVGSWDEVSRLFASEGGEGLEIEGGGNFVYSDIPVALAGVSDLVVVVKNGAALVCPKGSTQMVKSIVQELREKGRDDLL